MLKQKKTLFIAKKIKFKKKEEEIPSVVKKRRNVYSNETKQQICLFIEEYGYSEVLKQTGLPLETLKTMKKAYNGAGFKEKRGKKVTYPDLEADVKAWILDRRLKGIKITTRRTLCYVQKLAKDKNYTKLSFTWGWLRGFLKRNKFSLRKPSTSCVQPDGISDKVQTFAQEIKHLLTSGIYEREFVFNLDETSVVTEVKKEKTIASTGTKRVKVNSTGKDKECHTVLLGGTMTGHKFRAFMIFKGKGVKSIKNVPGNIKVGYREENSWMDRKNMKVYIKDVLSIWALDIPQNKRGLLLIDNYEGHVDKSIEEELNKLRIDIKRLPSNTTPYLQPMDISVNAPFKQYYAEQWDDFQYQIDSKPLSKTGKYKAPTREEKLRWVSNAWAKVSKETIEKGFKPYWDDELEEMERVRLEEESALEQFESDMFEAMINQSTDSGSESDDKDFMDNYEDFKDLLQYEIY